MDENPPPLCKVAAFPIEEGASALGSVVSGWGVSEAFNIYPELVNGTSIFDSGRVFHNLAVLYLYQVNSCYIPSEFLT